MEPAGGEMNEQPRWRVPGGRVRHHRGRSLIGPAVSELSLCGRVSAYLPETGARYVWQETEEGPACAECVRRAEKEARR